MIKPFLGKGQRSDFTSSSYDHIVKPINGLFRPRDFIRLVDFTASYRIADLAPLLGLL